MPEFEAQSHQSTPCPRLDVRVIPPPHPAPCRSGRNTETPLDQDGFRDVSASSKSVSRSAGPATSKSNCAMWPMVGGERVASFAWCAAHGDILRARAMTEGGGVWSRSAPSSSDKAADCVCDGGLRMDGLCGGRYGTQEADGCGGGTCFGSVLRFRA